MLKGNINKKIGMYEGIYSGVQRGLILVPLSFTVFISDIFIFLAKIYTKEFETLDNRFYENYMVLNLPNCELLSYGKTNRNKAFTCHENWIKIDYF